jgi:AcrR family transcriptional regulator
VAARDQLLAAAERLIAERGIDVPVRDIALAAGQRNNSAVNYHFGSRDGLIDAVIERRMVALEARRMELLAAHEAVGADDVRSLVAVLVTPQLELVGQPGATHYARFLEAVRNHPVIIDRARLEGAGRAAVRIVALRLDRALGEFPAALRRRRLEAMASAMFALLADFERAVESGAVARARRERVADDIVDMLAGLVTAAPITAVPTGARVRR